MCVGKDNEKYDKDEVIQQGMCSCMGIEQYTCCCWLHNDMCVQAKKLIVFICGPITHSEIRTIHTLSTKLGRDIVRSQHIHTLATTNQQYFFRARESTFYWLACIALRFAGSDARWVGLLLQWIVSCRALKSWMFCRSWAGPVFARPPPLFRVCGSSASPRQRFAANRSLDLQYCYISTEQLCLIERAVNMIAH